MIVDILIFIIVYVSEYVLTLEVKYKAEKHIAYNKIILKKNQTLTIESFFPGPNIYHYTFR